MESNKKWLLAVGWALGSLLILAGFMPVMADFFRETLPFIMADMFTGALVGLLLGGWQWLMVRGVYRRPLLDWVSLSTYGGVIGALIGGMGTVLAQSLSSYPLPAIMPVALIVWFVGLLPWIAMGEKRPNERYFPLIVGVLGLAAATSAWGAVLMLSLLKGLLIGSTLTTRNRKAIKHDEATVQQARDRLLDTTIEATPDYLAQPDAALSTKLSQ